MATTNIQKFAGDVDVRGTIVCPVVSYASNRDAPYLIAAGTIYDGTSTNWATEGIQHRIKTSSGGVPRVTIDTPQGGESFCVTNDGKVGIGTDSPEEHLHVYDASTASLIVEGGNNTMGTDTAQIILRNNVARRAGLEFQDDSDNSQIWHIGRRYVGGGSSTNLSFSNSSDTEVMTMKNDGKIGINDSTPYNKLSVVGKATVGEGAGTGTAAYHAGTLNVIGGTSRAKIHIENNSSVGSPAIIFGEGGVFTEDTAPTIKKKEGANDLLLNAAGNVGISLPNPAYKLDVGGTLRSTKLYLNDYVYHNGDTNTLMGFPNNDTIGFYTNGSWRMYINSSGYIGVGTTNPYATLHITTASYPTIGTNWATYFSSNYRSWVSRSQYSLTGSPLSIWCAHQIVTQQSLWAHRSGIASSDRRIKKDIVDVNDESALEQLRLLQPKRYKYIDSETNGGTSETVWGFIAQEVSEVIPYSTSIRDEYIPNIYQLNDVLDDDIIEFETFNVNDFESEEDPIKIRLCSGEDIYIETKITEIINDHTVRIEFDDKEKYSNLYDISLDISEEDGTMKKKVFVYGEKVNDFHGLQKDAIWTISTAALQEVDRQLQSEKTKVEILETQVADLITRVTNLEAAT